MLLVLQHHFFEYLALDGAHAAARVGKMRACDARQLFECPSPDAVDKLVILAVAHRRGDICRFQAAQQRDDGVGHHLLVRWQQQDDVADGALDALAYAGRLAVILVEHDELDCRVICRQSFQRGCHGRMHAIQHENHLEGLAASGQHLEILARDFLNIVVPVCNRHNRGNIQFVLHFNDR